MLFAIRSLQKLLMLMMRLVYRKKTESHGLFLKSEGKTGGKASFFFLSGQKMSASPAFGCFCFWLRCCLLSCIGK